MAEHFKFFFQTKQQETNETDASSLLRHRSNAKWSYLENTLFQ